MIIKAVKDGGYQASSYDDALVDNDDLSNLKRKLIYCFIALGLLMYVSMSSMLSYPIPILLGIMFI